MKEELKNYDSLTFHLKRLLKVKKSDRIKKKMLFGLKIEIFL